MNRLGRIPFNVLILAIWSILIIRKIDENPLNIFHLQHEVLLVSSLALFPIYVSDIKICRNISLRESRWPERLVKSAGSIVLFLEHAVFFYLIHVLLGRNTGRVILAHTAVLIKHSSPPNKLYCWMLWRLLFTAILLRICSVPVHAPCFFYHICLILSLPRLLFKLIFHTFTGQD